MEHIKLAPPRRRPRRIAKKVALRLGAKYERDWIALYIRAAFSAPLADRERESSRFRELMESMMCPPCPRPERSVFDDLIGRAFEIGLETGVLERVDGPAAHNVVRQDRLVTIVGDTSMPVDYERFNGTDPTGLRRAARNSGKQLTAMSALGIAPLDDVGDPYEPAKPTDTTPTVTVGGIRWNTRVLIIPGDD
jgi:hypothetical protein